MLDRHELQDLSTSLVDNKGSKGLAERRLLVAVLRQTLEDLIEYAHRSDPNSRRIFDTASAWIFATHQRCGDDHMTFAHTCDLLDLEPCYVRGLVRRLLGTQAQRLRPRAA